MEVILSFVSCWVRIKEKDEVNGRWQRWGMRRESQLTSILPDTFGLCRKEADRKADVVVCTHHPAFFLPLACVSLTISSPGLWARRFTQICQDTKEQGQWEERAGQRSHYAMPDQGVGNRGGWRKRESSAKGTWRVIIKVFHEIEKDHNRWF